MVLSTELLGLKNAFVEKTSIYIFVTPSIVIGLFITNKESNILLLIAISTTISRGYFASSTIFVSSLFISSKRLYIFLFSVKSFS